MTEELRESRPGKFELLLDFIETHGYKLVGAGLLLIAAAGVFFADFTVPRRAKLVLLVALIVSPFGKMTGDYVVKLLYDPNYIYLVDLDARHVDGALFQFPFYDFREMNIRDGQLTELTPNLYVGKDVDLAAKEVTGTWRGTLDDRELLTALQAVRECRGQLQDDAKRGWVIDTHGWSIVWRSIKEEISRVVESFEKGTLPDDGEPLQDALDDALEQYDLDKELAEIADEMDANPADAETDLDDIDTDLDPDDPEPQEAPTDD